MYGFNNYDQTAPDQTTTTAPKAEILQAVDVRKYYESELGPLGKPDSRGWSTVKCKFHDDQNPSLGIDTNTGAYHCPACGAKGDLLRFHMEVHGCDFKAALGDLARFAGVNGSTPRQAKAKIVATYDYTNADGNLLFQVVRFDPKDFRQRRPDGNGGWVWNLKGIEPVLVSPAGSYRG